ncbi:Hypothetical protein R9X50_00040300 [Acrodontium crateriforme]|uniref:Zn(2)-C6 fungal-type domain-containing protein n=1 Tax=Acrodontium crateriforme TaxID=150365 RepID=A0AAQ3LXE8_9PEZI|nr:Hypothetical protein R9X50_00040300 [Acrodontium crateriforme]
MIPMAEDRPSTPTASAPPAQQSQPQPAKSYINPNPVNPQDASRPSSAEATQKKTKRKSFGDSTVTVPVVNESGVVKPKQSKSRNGCATCKAKRLKCGEEKPACQQCIRRGIECGGYRKDFKWRPFEETNLKFNMDKNQQRVSPPSILSASSSKEASPLVDTGPNAIPSAPGLLRRPKAPQGPRKDVKRVSQGESDRPVVDFPERVIKARRKGNAPPPTSLPQSTNGSLSFPGNGYLPTLPLRDKDSRPNGRTTIQPLFDRSSNSPNEISSAVSPTFPEILFQHDVNPNFNFSLPEDFTHPAELHPPMLLAEFNDTFQEEDIEVVLRNDFDANLNFATSPDIPTSSDSPLSLPVWRAPNNYLYQQPYFAENSTEMLHFRFDKLTCGILSVMDGEHENPWRNLIWPLAQQSPALYNATMAMTAFHSSKDVPSLRVVGHEHKQKSIEFIQEGIRDNSMTDQMAIATALALGFSEAWDQHTTTGNTHIKGAQVLVKRALADHQRNPLGGLELARLKFLCNAWVYMDVMARLTSFDSDESNDFDNTFFFSIDPPDMVMGNSARGFGIDFGMPIDARLDPLMGCAGTLFPLIGRVANLVRKVCRSLTNSPAIISQANDLKIALETWEPPAYIESPEDPTTNVQHALQTAEAYRWATLLHLHQSVPELPSLESPELAQRVLQYLATVPLSSRTVIIQIYPLMAAGCEAKNDEDREWVTHRWNAMGQRMRVGIIDKCLAVTHEVWKRKDAYEAQPSTRRRLVATADLQPARNRGSPELNRRECGLDEHADPGRIGMVYSYVETDVDSRATSGGGAGTNNTLMDGRRPNRFNPPGPNIGTMDVAYTVRGHLHWVGVMWDWGWEVLLG